MSEEEVIEYCRKLVIANLKQYVDTDNSKVIVKAIYDLQNDKTNKELLEHCKGIINLLKECKRIIEDKGANNE